MAGGNPNHDPNSGEFTSGGAGGVVGAVETELTDDEQEKLEGHQEDVNAFREDALKEIHSSFTADDSPFAQMIESYNNAIELDPSLENTEWGKQHGALIDDLIAVHKKFVEAAVKFNS
jgi:hypothetical protein